MNWGHEPTGTPTGSTAQGRCPYCSTELRTIFHLGPCPRIKSIEYFPDGRIKRIELREIAERPIWKK